MAAKHLRHERLERGAERSLTIPQLLLELLSGSGRERKRLIKEMLNHQGEGLRGR